MNPPASSSAPENQGAPGWGCDQSWVDRHHPHHHHHHHHSVAMSVGLESRQFQGGRMLEYEWGNPMLFAGGGGGQMDEEEERKPQIISGPLTQNMGVQYNGNVNVTMNGNGMLNSSGFSHFSQNPLGNLLSSSGTRSFGGVADGIRSSSSSLLYLGGGGNGLSGYCDSRAALELQRHHLLGMMGMEQKSLLHDCIVKREELCPGDFQARIGLNLGGRTYFSAEDNVVNRLYKRPRAISPGSQVARCQAEGCKADLSNAKHYHRRHKVCELHSKASTVVTGGLTQRFCQQCSRFHILSEFDEGKRSCRKRLADHNRRRRKPQPNAATVTPLTVETTTALKVVEEEENGESNHTASLHRPEPICRTEAQALLTAISLSPSVPLVLQNGKGQQHYLQQTGPNLSLGGGGGGGMALDYGRQPGGQNYNGLEIAIPWLRPAGSNSEFTGSEKNSSNVESGGSSSNVQVFSSIQNLLPLQSSTDQLGSPADWMVNASTNTRNQHYGSSSDLNLQTSLESQQMFSLLEKDVTTNDRAGQQSHNEVEYLSVQHQQQGGLNSKHSVDGHSEHGNQLNTNFSGMQSLRSLGQSMYQNIL